MKLLLLLLSAGKLLTTGGTMLISVVAYAFVYGWRYAAGFVGLIFASAETRPTCALYYLDP